MIAFVISKYADPFPEGIERNLHAARVLCRAITEAGDTPYAPHLFFTQFLDDKTPSEREAGINGGHVMMEICDWAVVFRPDGVLSRGMAADILHAEDLKLPIKEAIYNDGRFSFVEFRR